MTTDPITLAGVGMRYRGARQTPALHQVDLQLRGGIVTGLVGKNGAGKSTLLEICLGALRPTAGEVRWFGDTRLSRSARRGIGHCPDRPRFPARLRASEVLALQGALLGMRSATVRQQIVRHAEQLDLHDVLDRRVDTLSHGTRQRLGLLRAILGAPTVLLCDETFAPLDPLQQTAVRQLLRELADGGMGVLISSHQLAMLPDLADEVIILHAGTVVRRVPAVLVRARWLLTIECAAIDPGQGEALLRALPGSWIAEHQVHVPLPSSHAAEIAIEEVFSAIGLPILGTRMEEFSLEAAFLNEVTGAGQL